MSLIGLLFPQHQQQHHAHRAAQVVSPKARSRPTRGDSKLQKIRQLFLLKYLACLFTIFHKNYCILVAIDFLLTERITQFLTIRINESIQFAKAIPSFARIHYYHLQYGNILTTLCPSSSCSNVLLSYHLPYIQVYQLNHLISHIRLLEKESYVGTRYSVSQIQNMVSPPHPSSTSGTLHNPAQSFQEPPEPSNTSRT